MSDTVPTIRNYQALANAICKRAILDYEMIISQRPLSSHISEKYCNKNEVTEFLKTQVYVDLDLYKVAKQIERRYKEEWIPYVREHEQEIIENWKTLHKWERQNFEAMKRKHPYFCPICGGIIRPGSKRTATENYIVCTGCELNVRKTKKKEETPCTTQG